MKSTRWIVLTTFALMTLFLFLTNCMQWSQDASSSPTEHSDQGIANGRVISLDADRLVLEFSSLGIDWVEREIQGKLFTQALADGHALFGKPGDPGIPFYSVLFAVPAQAQVDLEVDYGPSTFIDDVLIFPVQYPAPDTIDVPTPPFTMNSLAYKSINYAPTSNVFLEDEKRLRGLRVNQLWVSPVRYHPSARRLELIDQVTVTISFKGDVNSFFEDALLRSPVHDRLFFRLLANGSVVEPPASLDYHPATDKQDEARFVIIAHPDFSEAANALKDWKIRTGMSTAVVTTDQIGSTASSILAYLSDAYHNGTVPVEYAMLIGDAEFVPTHYRTFHSAHFSMGGSDHHYGCVDGNDEFADIGIGRISVDTADQAMKRVKKIIDYEKAVVKDESFYSTSQHFAYFQDDDKNGTADRRFSLTSEEMVRWFSEVLEGSHISPNRCFATSSRVDPKKWSKLSNYHFFADWWTLPQDVIPEEIKRANGFDWICHESDILSAVNEGAFFVTHRDHGGSTGWGDPRFRVDDAMKLTNGDKLPVLWSINCQTGWFDNETDSFIDGSGNYQVSFAEAWERNPNGGAVGIIAATRISYSGYNDRLVWGWMDALWPGYIPLYPEQKNTDSTSPALSDALNYGKVYMTTVYTPSSTRKVAMEEFHWFGDPTMKMWVQPPKDLSVKHAFALNYDTATFPVEIDVPDALATLRLDGRIVGTAVSTGSELAIPIDLPPGREAVMLLTVSKEGYRPYEKQIHLVQCADNADCQDEIFCNGEEQCVLNVCQAAPEARDCDDGQFCNGIETCDEQAGACLSSGSPCSDATACDEDSDACKSGEDESDSGDTCGG